MSDKTSSRVKGEYFGSNGPSGLFAAMESFNPAASPIRSYRFVDKQQKLLYI